MRRELARNTSCRWHDEQHCESITNPIQSKANEQSDDSQHKKMISTESTQRDGRQIKLLAKNDESSTEMSKCNNSLAPTCNQLEQQICLMAGRKNESGGGGGRLSTLISRRIIIMAPDESLKRHERGRSRRRGRTATETVDGPTNLAANSNDQVIYGLSLWDTKPSGARKSSRAPAAAAVVAPTWRPLTQLVALSVLAICLLPATSDQRQAHAFKLPSIFSSWYQQQPSSVASPSAAGAAAAAALASVQTQANGNNNNNNNHHHLSSSTVGLLKPTGPSGGANLVPAGPAAGAILSGQPINWIGGAGDPKHPGADLSSSASAVSIAESQQQQPRQQLAAPAAPQHSIARQRPFQTILSGGSKNLFGSLPRTIFGRILGPVSSTAPPISAHLSQQQPPTSSQKLITNYMLLHRVPPMNGNNYQHATGGPFAPSPRHHRQQQQRHQSSRMVNAPTGQWPHMRQPVATAFQNEQHLVQKSPAAAAKLPPAHATDDDPDGRKKHALGYGEQDDTFVIVNAQQVAELNEQPQPQPQKHVDMPNEQQQHQQHQMVAAKSPGDEYREMPAIVIAEPEESSAPFHRELHTNAQQARETRNDTEKLSLAQSDLTGAIQQQQQAIDLSRLTMRHNATSDQSDAEHPDVATASNSTQQEEQQLIGSLIDEIVQLNSVNVTGASGANVTTAAAAAAPPTTTTTSPDDNRTRSSSGANASGLAPVGQQQQSNRGDANEVAQPNGDDSDGELPAPEPVGRLESAARAVIVSGGDSEEPGEQPGEQPDLSWQASGHQHQATQSEQPTQIDITGQQLDQQHQQPAGGSSFIIGPYQGLEPSSARLQASGGQYEQFFGGPTQSGLADRQQQQLGESFVGGRPMGSVNDGNLLSYEPTASSSTGQPARPIVGMATQFIQQARQFIQSPFSVQQHQQLMSPVGGQPRRQNGPFFRPQPMALAYHMQPPPPPPQSAAPDSPLQQQQQQQSALQTIGRGGSFVPDNSYQYQMLASPQMSANQIDQQAGEQMPYFFNEQLNRHYGTNMRPNYHANQAESQQHQQRLMGQAQPSHEQAHGFDLVLNHGNPMLVPRNRQQPQPQHHNHNHNHHHHQQQQHLAPPNQQQQQQHYRPLTLISGQQTFLGSNSQQQQFQHQAILGQQNQAARESQDPMGREQVASPSRKFKSGLYQIEPPKLDATLMQQQQQQPALGSNEQSDEQASDQQQQRPQQPEDQQKIDEQEEGDDEDDDEPGAKGEPSGAPDFAQQQQDATSRQTNVSLPTKGQQQLPETRQVSASFGVAGARPFERPVRRGQVFSEPLASDDGDANSRRESQMKSLKVAHDVTLYDLEAPQSSTRDQQQQLIGAPQAATGYLDTQVYTLPYTMTMQPDGRAHFAPSLAADARHAHYQEHAPRPMHPLPYLAPPPPPQPSDARRTFAPADQQSQLQSHSNNQLVGPNNNDNYQWAGHQAPQLAASVGQTSRQQELGAVAPSDLGPTTRGRELQQQPRQQQQSGHDQLASSSTTTTTESSPADDRPGAEPDRGDESSDGSSSSSNDNQNPNPYPLISNESQHHSSGYANATAASASASASASSLSRSPSSFCQGRAAGLYADESRLCKTYYQCAPTGHQVFSCNNQTQFNQKTQNCDWWYNVDCGGHLLQADFGLDQVGTAASDSSSSHLVPASSRSSGHQMLAGVVSSTPAASEPTSSEATRQQQQQPEVEAPSAQQNSTASGSRPNEANSKEAPAANSYSQRSSTSQEQTTNELATLGAETNQDQRTTGPPTISASSPASAEVSSPSSLITETEAPDNRVETTTTVASALPQTTSEQSHGASAPRFGLGASELANDEQAGASSKVDETNSPPAATNNNSTATTRRLIQSEFGLGVRQQQQQQQQSPPRSHLNARAAPPINQQLASSGRLADEHQQSVGVYATVSDQQHRGSVTYTPAHPADHDVHFLTAKSLINTAAASGQSQETTPIGGDLSSASGATNLRSPTAARSSLTETNDRSERKNPSPSPSRLERRFGARITQLKSKNY